MSWYETEVWAAGRPYRRWSIFEVSWLVGRQANALHGSCTSRHNVEQIVMTIAGLSTTPAYRTCRSVMFVCCYDFQHAVHQSLVLG